MSGQLASIFNTHVELIDAPAAIAWDTFLDRGQWMDSFLSRRVVSGLDGAIGSKAEVRMDVASSPLRLEEILHIEPSRRLVVRISVGEAAVLVHADFQFDDCPAGCRLQVSIHTIMQGGDIASLDDLRIGTQRKLAHDFGKLRDRAEHLAGASSSNSAPRNRARQGF